ncbi:MAG: electron transfer flavoprotein subunit beta/FixA family protein [Victivallales bacterium]|nr:electron transfer flavoprotein subunit beta/FixA family protein [Victivallales bacterium]
MRIVVPIKQVPETSGVRMDEETGTVVRDGAEVIVNPLDLYAIETALQLCGPEDETVALSMGPAKAADALREAIAMGCDQGILLSDRAFAASDTWATSHVLAAAVRRLGLPDLIICGERATDGDTGQVGPELAAFLDLPVATYVSRIVSHDGECIVVERLVETGYETLEVQLPAVLTVVKEAADPRLPTLRGKQRSRQVEIPVWSAEDLAVSAADVGLSGSPTRVVRIFRPSIARECEMLMADDPASIEGACDRIVEYLAGHDLL